MSQKFNTDDEENRNDEVKKTIRVSVDAKFALEVLKKLKAPMPDAYEIDEIQLVITK